MENKLLESALFYSEKMEYSIIPLFGESYVQKIKNQIQTLKEAKANTETILQLEEKLKRDPLKQPRVKWDQYTRERATKEQITEWWSQWPDSGIAIITGEISNLLVVDSEQGADLTLFGLEELDTPTSLTGGGGKHFYFSYSPGLKNAVRFAPLYDFRSDGGYVLAVPSSHKSGKQYEWEIPVGLVSTLPLPKEVHTALTGNKKSPAKDVFSSQTVEGSRNQTATSAVGTLLSRFPRGQWESHAWPLFQDWNKAHSVPALSVQELRGVFDSIASSEASKNAVYDYVFTQGDSSEDSLTILVETSEGAIQLDFSEVLSTGRRELECLLRVSLSIPGLNPLTYTARLNAFSPSTRDTIVRGLNANLGKDTKWGIVLSNACERLAEWWQTKSPVLNISDIGEEHFAYSLEPFVVRGAANILFGKGGSGKTFLACAIGIAIATGQSFLEFSPGHTGRVLFIDYEGTPGSFKSRLRALLNGNMFNGGKTVEDLNGRVRYLHAQGVPLSVMTERLKKEVAEFRPELIIVDSAAPASGRPEEAESAVAFFNTLAKLKGVASLTIAHETKQENKSYAFGSVFWHNTPRNIWNCQIEGDGTVGESSIVSVLHHKKANDDYRHHPFALTWNFDIEDRKLARINLGYGTTQEWQETQTATKAILELLSDGEARGSKSVQSELTNFSQGTIRTALTRLVKECKVSKEDGYNGKYALLKLAKKECYSPQKDDLPF